MCSRFFDPVLGVTVGRRARRRRKQQVCTMYIVVQSHRCHGPSDDNDISQSRGQNRMNEGHDAEGRGYPRIEAPDKKECVVSLRRAYQLVSEAAGGHELKPSKNAERRVGDGPRLVKSSAIFQQTILIL